MGCVACHAQCLPLRHAHELLLASRASTGALARIILVFRALVRFHPGRLGEAMRIILVCGAALRPLVLAAVGLPIGAVVEVVAIEDASRLVHMAAIFHFQSAFLQLTHE